MVRSKARHFISQARRVRPPENPCQGWCLLIYAAERSKKGSDRANATVFDFQALIQVGRDSMTDNGKSPAGKLSAPNGNRFFGNRITP